MMGLGAIDMETVIRAVLCLLATCSPASILRRIISIIVDAVETVALAGFRANILDKRGKAVAPAPADRNTAPPISVIVVDGFNFTSINHRTPHRIQRVIGVEPEVTFRPASSRASAIRHPRFMLEASARLYESSTKMASASELILSTIAFASPFGLYALAHRQPSEPKARYV